MTFKLETANRRRETKSGGKVVKKDKFHTDMSEDLRRRAETQMAGKKIKDIQRMTEEDVCVMTNELEAHKMEIETLNKELRRAHTKAKDALRKYTDLYDSTPVGYFTFDRQGTILEVNLAGAALLDIERRNLIDERFQLFVKPDYIHVFNTFCTKAFEMNRKQTCKLKLMKNDKSFIYVQIEGVAIESRKGKQCRAAITDITAYKHEEEKIHLFQTLLTAIAETGDVQSMLDIILRRVCEVAGWMYAEVWIPSSDGSYLECGGWYSNLGHVEEFAVRSKEFTFSPGVGIPGHVWATKQPVWIKDVAIDPNYLRAKIVENVGLQTAFAFPLFTGAEVVAVVVLYTLETIGKDEQLVNFVCSLSTHLGWVIKRKQLEEKMQHMAYNDVLTALPNRLQFKDRLTIELYRAKLNKEMLAVMFVDLDRFKVINDTLGHAVGDQILQCMAQRLKSCIREMDAVSRFGGDEFTLVLPKIGGTKDAAMLAEKIIEAIRQPMTIGNREIITTTSVGIALFPVNGEDVETLMYQADIAMYHAKEAGKNNYQFSVNLSLNKPAKLEEERLKEDQPELL